MVVFFIPRQSRKMKQNTKYVSECVLYFYTWFFHIVFFLFDTTLPALNKFFEPVAVELFRLFSKHFSCSSFNFFITYGINLFEMFWRVESNQKSDGAKSMLWVGCGTTSNLMSSIITEVAALGWDAVIMLTKHQFCSPLWTQLICCFSYFRVFT